MVGAETRLFCRLDGLTPTAREQQRLAALAELNLLEADTVPVFEEASQTAARFLQAPICILALMTPERLWLKSTVGLSNLGLMNDLATSRQIPRDDAFCTYVVDSYQPLAIGDTFSHPVFASSSLVQQHGIRAYLGVPLLTASGQCIGTIAVMDLVPRTFTQKDIEFLQLTARWSLSEFERNRLINLQQRLTSGYGPAKPSVSGYGNGWESEFTTGNTDNLPNAFSGLYNNAAPSNLIKLKLLTELTEELRTPLTSVMGMASVLCREVYGPLTSKQKEYLEIIRNSGQQLVSLVEEIVELGILDETAPKLNITSVDIEMLCQQAINNLLDVAKQRQQQIRLSVEPTHRIWFLDKDKVRQMLYYLVFSIIQSTEPGGVVRIHVSRKNERLSLAVWVSHPWLGDSLPQVEFYQSNQAVISNPSESTLPSGKEIVDAPILTLNSVNQMQSGSSAATIVAIADRLPKQSSINSDRERLGLLLTCQLVEIHGGQISLQGSPESGYRYMISLPHLSTVPALYE